jgi:hypothetical protein
MLAIRASSEKRREYLDSIHPLGGKDNNNRKGLIYHGSIQSYLVGNMRDQAPGDSTSLLSLPFPLLPLSFSLLSVSHPSVT